MIVSIYSDGFFLVGTVGSMIGWPIDNIWFFTGIVDNPPSGEISILFFFKHEINASNYAKKLTMI